jgi:hypothetical protein
MKSSRCTKPTWHANCRYFGLPTSEFVFARLDRMVCKEDTELYIGSGGICLRPIRTARVPALICSRGYKRTREGTGSQVSGGEVLCGCVSILNFSSSLLRGSSPFLLYAKGQGLDTRKREVVEIPLFLLPACGPRWSCRRQWGVPTPLPGATCDVHLKRADGAGPWRAWLATCAPTRWAM